MNISVPSEGIQETDKQKGQQAGHNNRSSRENSFLSLKRVLRSIPGRVGKKQISMQRTEVLFSVSGKQHLFSRLALFPLLSQLP